MIDFPITLISDPDHAAAQAATLARLKRNGTPARYAVQKMTYDGTRPYAVVATFRSFNRVVGRYEQEAAAKRRARDLNRKGETA